MSFFQLLRSGNYGPIERVAKVLGNVGRKVVRRETCCGNYGEPGC